MPSYIARLGDVEIEADNEAEAVALAVERIHAQTGGRGEVEVWTCSAGVVSRTLTTGAGAAIAARVEAMRLALAAGQREIEQFHGSAYPSCPGGCPAHEALGLIRLALA